MNSDNGFNTENKTGVGIIGCGNISKVYCKNLPLFQHLNLVACADVVRERAEERAAEFHITALSVEELLAHPGIEIVVNLTIPDAHAEVSRAILKAGKHVYSEKPLATTRGDARKVLKRAKKKHLQVGGAPDTFLGGAWQTVRQLIDQGAIGEPVAAAAFFLGHGPEQWHPNPDFFYQPGAGPLFDLGPYYLTALINLLGPVRGVAALARVSFPERIAGDGHIIPVDTPTHVTGSLEFKTGALATLITSFDVWYSQLPRVEIYGSEGSLYAPDPNQFGGRVFVRGKDDTEWRAIPVELPYNENWRGLGVADMAYGIRCNEPIRCSGEMTFHVVDVMQSLLKSAEKGKRIEIKSRCERPAPLLHAEEWKIQRIGEG
ncbi:MAG TPA: Gfo/Idh/MocA family oxidoreductase [Anaerolineae bacterium]|nr:Gfo/Idh/MocA family oxidoreductase [Anaerolineae bacterium]